MVYKNIVNNINKNLLLSISIFFMNFGVGGNFRNFLIMLFGGVDSIEFVV